MRKETLLWVMLGRLEKLGRWEWEGGVLSC